MSDNAAALPTRNEATDLVNCKVLLNGTAMSGEYRITSLSVQKSFNKISAAKIVFADGDPAKQDFLISSKEDALTPGSKIEIQMGYHSKAATIFKGIVISHAIRSAKGKNSCLHIEARDSAFKLCIGRNNHCYADQGDSDIIESIAKKAGYAAGDLDIASPMLSHKQMVQYNVSDWDFIVSRAEMNGMLVLTDDNRLTVKKPDTSGEPAAVIAYGVDVILFESGIDGRSQLKEIKTHAWNYSDQKVEDSPDASVDFSESGNLKAADVADAMGIGEENLFHAGNLTDEELKAWGNARLLKSRLAKICGKVTVKGLSTIRPGQVIKLKGFSKRFNGPVFVTGISQQYDKSIWETEITFGLDPEWFYQKSDIIERPAAGLLPGISGLQIGIVMQLESDPDNQDRVKVRLPLVDDHEGIWARVASLDAGDARGSFFRPELKDEVVVGFLQGDPRHAVILGMLNSSAKPAPIKAKDANPEKGFVTRSKMKFIFNDEKKSVCLETPKGKKIAINDDEDSIVLSDQHQNKISLTADGITLESGKDIQLKATSGEIKLEALNISNKADAQFSAEGNATAVIKSSGQTVVKGSIVNIN
jgi:Rhs element Vgr protein